MKRVVIIGAGLTGLTIAYLLKKQGANVKVLEKEDYAGGAIRTYRENGYIFEAGPNTGVVSYPEVTELFEMLGLKIETANKSAEKRLILKNGQWYPLPSGVVSFMKTPLFAVSDKIRIMFEPFRKKGNNPNESVASLSRRRIGESFLDYAVNPFISGIYAGDPEKLITKYALPKLYNLEQQYGSFIGGSIKKSREKKTEREQKATKKVFSVKGGLGMLVEALYKEIGEENIILGARDISVSKNNEEGSYTVCYYAGGMERKQLRTKNVVSTVGSFALSAIFPFIREKDMAKIVNLNYARIVQVAVGLDKKSLDSIYTSFGGLIPQKENRKLLGVLFPSYCFEGRSPEDCSTLAIYLGGMRHPELFELPDNGIYQLVGEELKNLFGIRKNSMRFMRIFRHLHAIPQYEKSSGERFTTIDKIENENPGLILAGNIRDGIGMADRIRQAFNIASQLSAK